MCLRLMVKARGARFHLPGALDDEARVVGIDPAKRHVRLGERGGVSPSVSIVPTEAAA